MHKCLVCKAQKTMVLPLFNSDKTCGGVLCFVFDSSLSSWSESEKEKRLLYQLVVGLKWRRRDHQTKENL